MKKKYWYEEEDSLRSLQKEDETMYAEVIYNKYKGPSTKNNGRKAKNRLDLGRNCPTCAGRLRIQEETKDETLILFCMECGGKFHHQDVNTVTDAVDQLYRSIPDSMVLYYKEARREQLRVEAEREERKKKTPE